MTPPPVNRAQAVALGAPARRAILALLEESPHPVGVADLTGPLGLDHNAVRKHLAKLVEAGFVVEDREVRTAPGRPRLLYRLDPAATAANDGPYRRLAVLLATALASGEDPAVVGRAAALPAPPGPVPAATPSDALAARLAADGFEPSVRRRGGRTSILLGHCPFADAAVANPEAVCRLHLGLARGMADAVGNLRVDGLTAADPRRAGCRLDVTEATGA